jgi:hypothetical protein
LFGDERRNEPSVVPDGSEYEAYVLAAIDFIAIVQGKGQAEDGQVAEGVMDTKTKL